MGLTDRERSILGGSLTTNTSFRIGDIILVGYVRDDEGDIRIKGMVVPTSEMDGAQGEFADMIRSALVADRIHVEYGHLEAEAKGFADQGIPPVDFRIESNARKDSWVRLTALRSYALEKATDLLGRCSSFQRKVEASDDSAE